ncbi:hypothetical protein [Trinickia fusca]|uniref:hypothetical protein n=1 Tax=Trinickia fusca TaxID=2419777 RepID=UPI0011C3757E|nr:hypothetical protein [Trinickia fusca]
MKSHGTVLGRRLTALTLALSFACALPSPCRAHAASQTVKPHYVFAVVSGTMQSSADEASTQRLLDAIGHEPRMAFVVYDGNFKSAAEPCSDALYTQRQQLLEASRAPLVPVPGQHDWADCNASPEGGYDVAERLDFLRQTLFAADSSLGINPFALTRESEVTRFHSYRENVRWQTDDTVFVGLNVVGGNNHYLNAGGRNGEFDDRAIATAFWLEHAAEYAKRRNARALVVFLQANPDFARYERATERFSWLRLTSSRARDGYLEFKRSLVKAAQMFRGPIVLIHAEQRALPGGFAIDQPLFNDKGGRIANLTRIAIAPHERATQWVRVEVDFARQPPFRVSVRAVPKTLPPPPTLPAEPQPASMPENPETMPAIPAIPASSVQEPPMLPDTGHGGSFAPVTPGVMPGNGLPSSSVQGGS